MHAVLLTFLSDAPLPSVRDRLERHAEALLSARGFMTNTWVVDESILGGFHLFEDRRAADAFLQGELCDPLFSETSFSQFRVRHYDVIDDLSRSGQTRTPLCWSATSRARVRSARNPPTFVSHARRGYLLGPQL